MGLEHIALDGPNLGLGVGDILYLILLADGLGRGGEAEGLGGDAHHARTLLGIDGDVGRQSGFEFEVGVGGTDDDLVGDDVVGRRGLLAHLLHRTGEGVVGIGIDGEGDALAGLDLADVGLIHIGHHLHVGQIFGNGEEFWGGETGCDGLSLLHTLGQDHTVDGRGDGGIAEVGLGLLHLLLLLADLLAGLGHSLACRGNGLG